MGFVNWTLSKKVILNLKEKLWIKTDWTGFKKELLVKN